MHDARKCPRTLGGEKWHDMHTWVEIISVVGENEPAVQESLQQCSAAQ